MGKAIPWGPGRCWPDYGDGGIVGFSRSLMSILHGSPPDGPLRDVDWEGVEKVVVILVDGLGKVQLDHAFQTGAAPNLQRAAASGGMREITTTLPSTTATALVSLSTSACPEEHGFLGFRLFLKEVGVLADMIRLTVLNGQTNLANLGLSDEELMPMDTLLDRARKSGIHTYAVTRKEFLESGFTRLLYRGASLVGYHSCADLVLKTADICRKEARALIFAYWDTIDVLCHRHGSRSRAFEAALSGFDHILGRELLNADLKNVLLLLTADHGHVDTPPEGTIDLKEHQELMSCLSLPPAGDARLPYLHVRPGKLRWVADYLDDHFDDMAEWIGAEEALRAGLFGPKGDTTWLERLGDIVLLPRDGNCFTFIHGREEEPFVSRHGGTSPEEMLVPLLWCRL
jgi:predicted AlkP superfamily pyrophosphatase or phosphodiesterase